MINFNSDKFKLQPRTVKSALKKMKIENCISEENKYSEDIAIKICEYIIKNGTSNTKLSAGLALQEINKQIEELNKKKLDIKPIVHHVIKNKTYIPDEDVLEYVVKSINEHRWNKEYEELHGFSRIAKDLAGKYALKMYPNKDKKTLEITNEILYKYSNITRHMKEENLNFEDIASRYIFKNTIEILPVIKNILDIEMKD